MFKNIFRFASILFIATIFFGSVLGVHAAKYKVQPSSKEFVEGCNSSINIVLDTEGETTNAADVEIRYNPAEIEILDANGSAPGVQVKTGSVYELYVYNNVDTEAGVIKVAGASIMNPFSGSGKFATIDFKSKAGVSSSGFTIHYTGDGDTLDSNIADTVTSNDLLNGVTNGSFTFRTGPCFPDSTGPSIKFDNPNSSSATSDEAIPVSIVVSDSGDGVDLDTVVIKLNGVEYRASDSDVTVEGDKTSYTFTFVPRDELPSDKSSVIRVTAKDLAGNSSTRQLVFNYPYTEPPLPPDPEPCPECECEDNTVTQNVNNSILTRDLTDSIVIEKFFEISPGFGAVVFSFGILANLIIWLLLIISPILFYILLSKDKEENYARNAFERIIVRLQPLVKATSYFGFGIGLFATIVSFNIINLITFIVYFVLSGLAYMKERELVK